MIGPLVIGWGVGGMGCGSSPFYCVSEEEEEGNWNWNCEWLDDGESWVVMLIVAKAER